MFLKPITVEKNGKDHHYWALVKSVRTARGPRHQTVAYLGELSATDRTGWARLGRALDGGVEPALPLFDGAEGLEAVPETIEVRVRDVRVEDTRDFGDVYLGLALWRTLGLDDLLDRLIPEQRERVRGSVVAGVLALARFCKPASERHIAEHWYRRTALANLLGLPAAAVTKDRLYRTLDRVLPHKKEIETHLKDRFTTLFDARYDLLLYDLTSTYFEGQAAANPQAKRGYSRDKRSDCKQVCLGLVVTREGLPVGYRVFAGNRHDSTTLEEMVEKIEGQYGRLNRIWVVDRGLVSEENLSWLRQRGGFYVVGTPKSMLKAFAQALPEGGWTEVQAGVEVKLCPGPGGKETFVLCRSGARREKEKAMHERFEQRIEAGLTKLAGRLAQSRKKPDRGPVERQIGRLLGRNSRAAGLFEVQVIEVERGGKKGFLSVTWTQRETWREWARLSEGCYLLRTNLVGWTPERLWTTYIQLTQVEAAFRTCKSDLSLRPIWHQLEKRVQAHILFSFLAYALWKTLEQWMARSDLGHSPRTVVEELARIKTNDVILPTSAGRAVRLRCVTSPDPLQRILLSRLGLDLPARLGEPVWKTELKM